MILSIPQAGIFCLQYEMTLPEIVHRGKVERMYDKANPYLMVPVMVKSGSYSDMAIGFVDTGANCCFASENLRKSLHMEAFTHKTVGGAYEMVESGVYRTDIQIGGIQLKNVVTMEFNNSAFIGADFVIGMNVLSLGDLSVRRDGSFTFEI